MNIIGIDFSINHPSATIYNTNTKSFRFITVFNDTNVSKKYFEYLKELRRILTDTSIIFTTKVINKYLHDSPPLKSKDYSENESFKLDYYLNVIDLFVYEIQKYTKLSEDTYIVLEGFSFGSKGDKLFELGQATGILKHQLINSILKSSHERLIVKSPMTLKAHYLKGNSTKLDIYKRFIKIVDVEELIKSKFFLYMVNANDTKDNKVLTPKEIKSPWNDIIDSYIAVHYFLKNIKDSGL